MKRTTFYFIINKMYQQRLFQEPVKVLTSLSDYRDIPEGSPVLFFSPNCGHCVRFSPLYSDWARRMKRASPDTQQFALDLSEVDPVEVDIHNKLFPGDQLPSYVPLMSLYGGIGKRIDWGKNDGQKTPETLAVFFLNNAANVPDSVTKNIIDEFNLSKSDIGGGSSNSSELGGQGGPTGPSEGLSGGSSSITMKRKRKSPKRRNTGRKTGRKSPMSLTRSKSPRGGKSRSRKVSTLGSLYRV